MKHPAKNRKNGFSLLECIVSLALFATASVMVGQACFNTLTCLDSLKKDSYSDGLKDYIRANIVAQESLDEIESGFDIDDPDGGQINVIGISEMTSIADLFRLDYTVSSDRGEYSESMLLIRKNWYERSSDRDTILDDRTDWLDETRRQYEPERENP